MSWYRLKDVFFVLWLLLLFYYFFFQKNLWTVNYKKKIKLYSIIIAKTLENNRVIIILFFHTVIRPFFFLFPAASRFSKWSVFTMYNDFFVAFFFKNLEHTGIDDDDYDCNTPIRFFTYIVAAINVIIFSINWARKKIWLKL